jgi:hypothetical protein
MRAKTRACYAAGPSLCVLLSVAALAQPLSAPVGALQPLFWPAIYAELAGRN